MQILIFNLLNEELGLDISYVYEILRPQDIHPLPKAPEFIEGVINLRGHIVAVIDLRKRFNINITKDRPAMRIIICKANRFIVGLIVDSVNEVINLPDKNIAPPPGVVSMQTEDSHISGMAKLGKRVITILNLEEILTKQEAEKLSMVKK